MFALVSGSLQYGIMQRDQATHLTFGHSPHVTVTVILHVLRFISGVHVFYALALFWSVPTCVMLMVGYSMSEYQGNNSQLRTRGFSITFESYCTEHYFWFKILMQYALTFLIRTTICFFFAAINEWKTTTKIVTTVCASSCYWLSNFPALANVNTFLL